MVRRKPMAILASLLFLSSLFAFQQDPGTRQEESEDYYTKWLKEDVAYIITDEERSVFEKLTTTEERDQFIEQFWLRRDPDMATAANEFKDEHYRRIVYANERFTSGIPGWKTDRGRIYVIHGAPVEIEKHRSGESYQRPYEEGGGFTSVYAFEVWRYHHIEGIGPDVLLEFVDPSGSGEFRLARNPWEKDASLFNITAGRTIAEEIGAATRADHPYFKPYNADRYPGMGGRMKDNPFIRYENLIKAQRPQEIRFKDLQGLVDVRVGYENMPFELRIDYFRLNDQQLLVPLTVKLENRELGFMPEHGNSVARVAVYGLVTSMTNRVVAEFDQELMVSYRPEDLHQGLEGSSVYQRIVPVEATTRYKVTFVVKDLANSKVGVEQKAIIPPRLAEDRLETSSLLISDHILPLGDVPDNLEMFVIGDVKVRPSADNRFDFGEPLGAYLHLYNVHLDQTSLHPALKVSYRIFRGTDQVWEDTDASGESIHFFSGQRVVLIKNLPGASLPADQYRLQIDVEDRIAGKQASISQAFLVKNH